MLLNCNIPSSSGKPNTVLKRQQEGFLAPLPGSLRKSQHTKYPSQSLSLALHYLPFASRFSLPHFTLAVLSALSFRSPSLFLFALFARFLFACVLDCLLVTRAQDNTKLCDFTNTNNNDFISTPIAPLTDAETCEINAALLNLVMKEPFSGLPSEDAATHLNIFLICVICKRRKIRITIFSN